MGGNNENDRVTHPKVYPLTSKRNRPIKSTIEFFKLHTVVEYDMMSDFLRYRRAIYVPV